MASKLALIALLTFAIVVWETEARFGGGRIGGFRGSSASRGSSYGFGGSSSSRGSSYGFGGSSSSRGSSYGFGGSSSSRGSGYGAANNGFRGSSSSRGSNREAPTNTQYGPRQQASESSGSSFGSNALSFGGGMLVADMMNNNHARHYRHDAHGHVTSAPSKSNSTAENLAGTVTPDNVIGEAIKTETNTVSPSAILPSTVTTDTVTYFPIIHPDQLLDSPRADLVAVPISSTIVLTSTTEIPKLVVTSTVPTTTSTSTPIPVTAAILTSTTQASTVILPIIPFVERDPKITDQEIKRECTGLFENAGYVNGEVIDGRYYYYNDWTEKIHFDDGIFIETAPHKLLTPTTLPPLKSNITTSDGTAKTDNPKLALAKRELANTSPVNIAEPIVSTTQTPPQVNVSDQGLVVMEVTHPLSGQLLDKHNVASVNPYVRNFYSELKAKIEAKKKDDLYKINDAVFMQELNELKLCFRLYVKQHVIPAKQKDLLIY